MHPWMVKCQSQPWVYALGSIFVWGRRCVHVQNTLLKVRGTDEFIFVQGWRSFPEMSALAALSCECRPAGGSTGKSARVRLTVTSGSPLPFHVIHSFPPLCFSAALSNGKCLKVWDKHHCVWMTVEQRGFAMLTPQLGGEVMSLSSFLVPLNQQRRATAESDMCVLSRSCTAVEPTGRRAKAIDFERKKINVMTPCCYGNFWPQLYVHMGMNDSEGSSGMALFFLYSPVGFKSTSCCETAILKG